MGGSDDGVESGDDLLCIVHKISTDGCDLAPLQNEANRGEFFRMFVLVTWSLLSY